MKSLKILSLAVAVATMSLTACAQTKTESFKVNGNCGMCKSTIEKAAKAAGAKDAKWDVDKKELTVTYKSTTTNTAKIQQQVANAGYDNAGFTATTESYKKLHGCCQYDRSASPDASAKAGCCSGSAKCEHHEGEDHAKADCCKDGKCTMAGHDGKDCCKKEGAAMDCCKDGKCSKSGHTGGDCCKKE
jgi:periplasmic mercuric ion binding protein